MATIIALMISLGVISSSSEATPQKIDQFIIENPQTEFIDDDLDMI